jgi:hypothetical protein
MNKIIRIAIRKWKNMFQPFKMLIIFAVIFSIIIVFSYGLMILDNHKAKQQDKQLPMYIIKYYDGGKLIAEYDSIKGTARYENRVIFKYHGKERILNGSFTIEEK